MAYLQKTYASHGFTLLAFPCNQFGFQEPGIFGWPLLQCPAPMAGGSNKK